MQLDHYSPSTLSMKCPRRVLFYAKDKPKEGYPEELPETGFELHKRVEEALTTGDFTKLTDRFPHECTVLRRLYDKDPKTESWLEGHIMVDGKDKKIIGRADIIIEDGDRAKLIDAKSSWSPKVAGYHERQLETYAYMLLDQYQEVETQIYWIRYDFLTKSSTENSGLKTYSVFDSASIEERITEDIRRLDNILYDEIPSPEPNSSDCMFCDWSLSCPGIDVKGEMTLQELADKVVQLNAKKKKYENILKTRLNKSEQGRVDIGEDRFIGYYSYDRIEVDPLEFLQLADEVDLSMEDIQKVLSVNTRSFKSFVRDAPAFENLAEAKTKVRWSGATGKKK